MNEQPGLSVKTERGIHRCNSVIMQESIAYCSLARSDSTYYCIGACTSSLLIQNVCFVSETAFLIYLDVPSKMHAF